MLMILALLFLTFGGCVAAILISKNRTVVRWAFDTVKTLLGFFIGVATTFLGAPFPR